LTFTILSAAGEPAAIAIDSKGVLSLAAGRTDLDWWVRAEDRWHRGGQEVAVRQRLADDGAAIETLMRVPGGDIVQTAYVCMAPRGAGPVAVVEIRNDSAVPVALAFAVDGEVDLVGSSVFRDGALVLQLPGEPADTLFEGGASGFVFPLPHTATMRAAIPLTRVGQALGDPAELPTPDAVARGWEAHFAHACQLSLPDDRVQAVFDVARRRVVAACSGGMLPVAQDGKAPTELDFALAAAALAELGHADDSEVVLDAVGWREVPDVSGLLGDPLHLIAAASPTGAIASEEGEGDDGLAAASKVLLGIRQLILAEAPGELRFMAVLPAGWEGQPVEIHDAPTAYGQASVAVRWHGSRPALLWRVDGGGPFRLTAPGLEATWSSTDRIGEALLADFGPVES
jgi:hypothetical protein